MAIDVAIFKNLALMAAITVLSNMSMASLMGLSPSTASPSKGILSPGLISTWSPTLSSPSGISFVFPSGIPLCAPHGRHERLAGVYGPSWTFHGYGVFVSLFISAFSYQGRSIAEHC